MSKDELNLQWGFNPMQESYFLSFQNEMEHLVPARVTSVGQDHCWVIPLGLHGEFLAKVSGKLQDQLNEALVVGDWVVLHAPPGDHQFYRIEELLPRRTLLVRSTAIGQPEPLVANINWICVVTSFNDDFNENRIERALVMIEESGARPLIVVNKADLVTTEEQERVQSVLCRRFPEVETIFCSTLTGWGLDQLIQKFSLGETIAFLGMSGVGKSSLVNAILGLEKMQTQSIREDDSRGRHTTTSRNLLKAPQDYWIVDTPGIRSFAIYSSSENIDASFDDVTRLFTSCRFRDCTHEIEDGCGVQYALEEGELLPERWRHYQKLIRELRHAELKKDKTYLHQQKKMYRKRHKQMQEQLKLRKRY